MKKVLSFYKQFLQALNIKNYDDYSKNKLKVSMSYYITLVFTVFVIMLILMMPFFFQLPNKIEKQLFGPIEEFKFNINISTNGPIMIPSVDNPLVLINYNNRVPTEKAKLILHNNVVYFAFLFNQYTKDFGIYKDAKVNKEAISNIFAVIILLMLPTLLLIFFFYIFIKFLALMAVGALIAVALGYLMKYRVNYQQMFNISVYAVSLTLLLDAVFFALGISFYSIQYLPFIAYMLAGITKVGTKISSKGIKYIELR